MFNNLSSSGGENEILTKYFLFCDIVPFKTPQILSTFPAVILTPLQKILLFIKLGYGDSMFQSLENLCQLL